MSAGSNESESHSDESSQDDFQTDHLRALIRDCTDIPSKIGDAEFSRVDKRKIDKSLLRLLTERTTAGQDDASAAATRRRSEALSPFLGRTLICVLIRMPGVTYTIEIDPVEDRIIHWEWQPA